MKSIINIYLTLLMVILLSACKGTNNSAKEVFGVNTEPSVNINLMSITPDNKFLFTGESVQFSANGGAAPYIFELDYGVGVVSNTGLYVAPSFSGTAVIKATDSAGQEAFATITVSVAVSISPVNITIGTGDSMTFTGSGGLPPYNYSIVAGAGTIDSTSGLFDATGIASGSTVIEVQDSSNNTAYASVTINPALVISPINPTVGFNEQISFTTTGGNSPYTYTILTGAGVIDSSTGVFVSSNSPGSTVVRVTDSSLNTVDSVISIIDSPQITSTNSLVPIGRDITFSTTNGAPPYTYSIISGAGTIGAATGLYTAPSTIGTSVVQVTDINSNTDTVTITAYKPQLVATGSAHSCILDFSDLTTSSTKCFGRIGLDFGIRGVIGDYAQYFIGDIPSELGDSIPTINLGDGTLARAVRVGRFTSCAIMTDNRAKCWGNNSNGQLGIGNREDRGYSALHMGNNLGFLNLGTGRTVNSILPIEDAFDLNNYSACSILDNNSLKCWGRNSYGQLGLGSTNTISDSESEVGDGIPAVNLGADIPVKVSIGADHTCVLTATNNVKCWGRNSFGQTGLGTTNSTGDSSGETPNLLSAVNLGTGRSAKDICTGYYHTCAILDNDQVKCWGRNYQGELGHGNSTQNIGDASAEMGDNLPLTDLGSGRTAKKLACMSESTCAILDNDEVRCWGDNSEGQLGIGSTSDVGRDNVSMGDFMLSVNLGTGRTATKISSGTQQTCATLDNGDHKCWGRNDNANLAQGHIFDVGKSPISLGDNLAPINISSTQTITSIQVRDSNGCASLSDGSVKCWGSDYTGSRGTQDFLVGDEESDMGENLPTINIGSTPNFVEIKSYMHLNCALTTDSSLTCWGHGGEGARASGDGNSRGHFSEHWGDGNMQYIDFGSGRTVKNYDVGYRGGCAVLSDDSVKCWGRNDNGQLGHGDRNPRGDSFSEIGDGFIDTDLGNVSTPVEVASGDSFNCARFSNGGVKCWGYNQYGKLGIGNTTQKGDGGGEMGNSLPFVDLGTGVTSRDICTGDDFTCSLNDDDQVKCWGLGTRLGIGTNLDRGDDMGEMGDNLPNLDFGTGRSVKSMSCGRYHACVVLDNDGIKCWGYNGTGQLGIGSTAQIGDSPGEMGDDLPYVNLGTNKLAVDVFAGSEHTCATINDGSVKCWGDNQYGQLGAGHITTIGTLDITMGDNLKEVSYK